MNDTKPKKLWSQQTVEERVRTALRSEQAFINRIDPDDQALTHYNYLNNIGLYVLVDAHREFMRILENILETHEETKVTDWYSKFPPMTPWFPPSKSPTRPGVYMVDQAWRPGQETEAVFSYWDGVHWYPQGSTPDDARKWVCYGPIKARLFRKWRGLLNGD